MWVASSKDAAHISVGEDRGIAEVTLEVQQTVRSLSGEQLLHRALVKSPHLVPALVGRNLLGRVQIHKTLTWPRLRSLDHLQILDPITATQGSSACRSCGALKDITCRPTLRRPQKLFLHASGRTSHGGRRGGVEQLELATIQIGLGVLTTMTLFSSPQSPPMPTSGTGVSFKSTSASRSCRTSLTAARALA